MQLQAKHFDPKHTHVEFVYYLEQHNLKVGDEFDIEQYNEETRGNRCYFILEEHHFDENQVNPYFVYYINALGLQPGDGVRVYEFNLWATGKADEYRKQVTNNELTSIGALPGGYEAFGRYLQSFSRSAVNTQQLSLF